MLILLQKAVIYAEFGDSENYVASFYFLLNRHRHHPHHHHHHHAPVYALSVHKIHLYQQPKDNIFLHI